MSANRVDRGRLWVHIILQMMRHTNYGGTMSKPLQLWAKFKQNTLIGITIRPKKKVVWLYSTDQPYVWGLPKSFFFLFSTKKSQNLPRKDKKLLKKVPKYHAWHWPASCKITACAMLSFSILNTNDMQTSYAIPV